MTRRDLGQHLLVHFFLLAGGVGFAGHAFAQDRLTVTTQDGETYSCRLSHSDRDFTESRYYLCGTSDHPMILVRSGFDWKAITKPKEQPNPKEQTKPTGQSVPKFAEIASVKDGDQTVYARDENSTWETLETNRSKRPDTLKERSRELWGVLHAIDPTFGQFGGQKKERKKGTEAFEKAWATLFSSAKAEYDRISARFKSASPVTIELSNGQTLQCHRGKYRAPEARLKSSPLFSDPGCELFTCSSATLANETYDVLLYQGGTPDSWIQPHATLSRKGELGPLVSVVRSFAGAKGPENLLYEKLPAPAGENPFAASEHEVPAELKDAAEVLPQYFSQEWMGNRRHWQSRCEDKKIDGLLGQENAAFEKAQQILVKAETAQVVNWVNGVFSSRLLPKANVPREACQLSPGTYLSAQGAEKFDDFEKRFGGSLDQALSPEEARRVFAQVLEMKDIPFEYLPDGCQARAHVVANRLAKMGIQTQKVWISGDLSPIKNPQISWHLHVAPVIQVRNPDGTVSKQVIDPSLASEPISVEKWASGIATKGKGPLAYTSFPPPTNASFYQRAAVSFSPSSIYLPDLGQIQLTPEETMEKALQINATYRGYLDQVAKEPTDGAR